MNLNLFQFLVGQAIGRSNDLPEDRTTTLALIAGMMPGMQGVVLTAIIAQREKPEPAKDGTEIGVGIHKPPTTAPRL
jgi:hypothetical protein